MPGKNEKKIGEELNSWFSLLNNLLGFGAFQLGLTSLQFEKPAFSAMLSLIFIITLGIASGRTEFSVTFERLKNKQNKSERETDQYEKLRKKHFGFIATITKAPAYYFGFLFLVCIALGVIDKTFRFGLFK